VIVTAFILSKFFADLKYTNTGLTRAKAQSTPSSEAKDENSAYEFIPSLSDLCGLGVFAGDIPNFGCGYAALGPSW